MPEKNYLGYFSSIGMYLTKIRPDDLVPGVDRSGHSTAESPFSYLQSQCFHWTRTLPTRFSISRCGLNRSYCNSPGPAIIKLFTYCVPHTSRPQFSLEEELSGLWLPITRASARSSERHPTQFLWMVGRPPGVSLCGARDSTDHYAATCCIKQESLSCPEFP